MSGAETVSSAVYPIPQNPSQVSEQALEAVKRALDDGITRQRLELLLPLTGATDLDDWPGGVRQQFKAVLPMVESILRRLKVLSKLQGALNAEIWDQGDAVGAWGSDKLAAVVFLTPETIPKMRALAEGKSLVLMINPQWQPGQLISDFGFGRRKRNAEEFVSAFQDTYFLKQFRIFGDNVRLLRAYPGDWQVHLVDAKGRSTCIATQATRPSYKELEQLLKAQANSNSNKSWVERLQSEFAFNRDSLRRPP
ncbi:hypothetical protein WJX72_005755 [[Myrmecia] bisecta]|uniref:DUF1995 domain-containing protein n=1 Tax=[Myrmecia] bisecta TaxID=41462 RepID=A0AAW1PL45_9CHLO